MNNCCAYKQSVASMSTLLEITILFDKNNPKEAKRILKQGFREADRLIGIISAWQKGTELYHVNSNAGIKPVKVCDELFYLVKRSLKIAALTDSLFDVTFASIDKVWYFDRPMLKKPSHQEITNSVRNINHKYITLNETDKTLFITNKGTKIELGAIGKGFIANKIKEKLVALGIQSGLVNAGGDLTCWGKNEHEAPWKVGISDPHKKEKYIAWLSLENQAVATSGSYERFAEIEGTKYSHIIHPKTGYPVKGLQSVTVVSADAELCDAIATSVFLMGKEDGLKFANQFSDIQCFMVDDANVYHSTDNLKQRKYVQTA